MTPHNIYLKGFIGIRSGLGLDELFIDLDDQADGAQLVLLKGANGSGKSTILDNLHPYRLMPSRSSSYSPGAFSFYDHTLGDAEKTLEWSHQNVRYRSQLLIRGSNKTKKTEAYLHRKWSDDKWIPVQLPDGTKSDGKTATYDACLSHILGTPEMFFSSVFSAQNRRQLSSYTNGDIKSLMAELLNLEHITELGEQAAVVAKLLGARINSMRQELMLYQSKKDILAGFRRDIDVAKDQQLAVLDEKVNAQGAVTFTLQKLAAAERLTADAEEANQRRDALQVDITRISIEAEARRRELANDIIGEQFRRSDVQRRYQQDIGKIEALIRSTEERAAEQEKLLERRVEITAAADRVEKLRGALADAEETGRSTQARAELLKMVQQRAQQAERDIRAGESAIRTKTATLDALTRQAALIDDVPCTGTDLQPRCKLLADANKAREAEPTIRSEIDALQAGVNTALIAEVNIAAELELLKDADREVQAAIDEYHRLQVALTDATALAALLPGLDAAAANREQALGEIERLRAGNAESQAELDLVIADIDKRLNELQARKASVEASAIAQLAILQDDLDHIPVGDTAVVERAKDSHDEARNRLEAAVAAEIALRERIAALTERIAVLDQELAGATLLETEAKRLAIEISYWTLLAKALGRDGIVALCIDDAGPTLASLTNDLLLSCYGPRFTVSIQTQSETASGGLRETFDIRVFDADRDDEKSLASMSGGERIYINEAITRAIALYQALQSGRQYGTLFSDESDGALDPDRKLMFTQMKREMLKRGGYEREIFITHTQALWDLADAVIDLDVMRKAA